MYRVRLGCLLAIGMSLSVAAPLQAQTFLGGHVRSPEFASDVAQIVQKPAGPPPTPRHTGIKALFKDPESPGKGRFYNCPTGWTCEGVNSQKLKAYGLEDSYVNFRTGTGPALDAAISSAIRSVDSGVISAGFNTTVLPAASAGPIFQLVNMSGKFHGTICPTTPSGSRST